MFENLKCLSTDELSYLATTFAVTLSKDLDDDTLSIISSLFFSVGGTLGLIAKQRLLLTNTCDVPQCPDEKCK